jgi:hypothetical protein
MSNNKQKTSVEWFKDEILKKYQLKIDTYPEYKQAIAINRQQIIDAYHTNPLEAKWQNKGFEYYNETFNTK